MQVTVSPSAWAQETAQGVVPGTRQTIISFEDRAVQNEFKSNNEGRPIFESRVYIRKIPPGDKLVEVHRPATLRDFQQHPREYEAYQKRMSTPLYGTPLEAWAQLTTTQVFELKAMNIFTVEQLAELPDSYGSKFMGFQGFKMKALSFLKASKGQAEFDNMQAEMAKKDEEIAMLKSLLQRLETLEEKAGVAPQQPPVAETRKVRDKAGTL